MYFKSKKTSLTILGITSLVCSRAMFLFFNDPEGPNLLVVVVGAIVIYFLSLAIYMLSPLPVSLKGLNRLLLMVVIQIIIAAGIYFSLR